MKRMVLLCAVLLTLTGAALALEPPDSPGYYVLQAPAAGAAELQTPEIPDGLALYAVSGQLQPYLLPLPEEYPQSYSLAGHTWKILRGAGVEISPEGLITPAGTLWYYHRLPSGQLVGAASPSGAEDEFTSFEYRYGETTILLDGVRELTVRTVNYAEHYAQGVMNAFLDERAAPGMTEYQIAELCCRFVAENYDYSVNFSGYTGMIASGGGDCWASTGALLYMLRRQGVTCESHDASSGEGAGSGHVNVLARLDGAYYILDAGFEGTAPRSYAMEKQEIDSAFRYEKTACGKEVRITGLVIRSGVTELSIPAEIGGLPVTEIGPGAFLGNKELVSAVLPSTVRTLGKEAFYQASGLKSVSLAEGLETVGENCFCGCASLETLAVPSTVSLIEPGAFYRCDGLREITVHPENPAYRGVDGALFSRDGTVLQCFPAGKGDAAPPVGKPYDLREHMDSLKTEYTVPEGVAAIERGAFAGVHLAAVHFPDTLRDVRFNAFYNACVRDLTLPEGLTVLSSGSFQSAALGRAILPSTLREIEDGAFFQGRFTSGFLLLPEGLERVGTAAFAGIAGLYVRVPASVREIGTGAFYLEYGWSSMGASGSGNPYGLGAVFFAGDCRPETVGENAFAGAVVCAQPDSYLWDYAGENGLPRQPLDGEGRVELRPEWASAENGYYTGRPFQSYQWNTSDGTCPFSVNSAFITAEYSGEPVGIGSYTVTLTGHMFFSGSVELSFEIRPALIWDETCVDRSGCGLQYAVRDVEAEIVAVIPELLPARLVIPETLDGCPVTAIGDEFLYGAAATLKSVAIPATVRRVGKSAFGWCDPLESVAFAGTRSQWERVEIGPNNGPLLSAPLRVAEITEIAGVRFSGDRAAVRVNHDLPEDCRVLLAAYGSRGRMLSLEAQVLTPGAGDYAFPLPEGAAQVRVLVLDAASRPRCAAPVLAS